MLFVPTYNYLSSPIIEKLAILKHFNTTLFCLDFYQPRADFGLFPDTSMFSSRKKIYPANGIPGILEMIRLRDKLIHYLNELDPDLIITFSDVTFFARCIKGTPFEAKLLVIQPCLLSPQPPKWQKKFIYSMSKLANMVLACPVFREKHYWGELLERASYCVWSKVEQKSRKVAGKVHYCGSFFMDLPHPSTIRASTNQNSALVIVPDLPYYTKAQIDLLTLSYARVMKACPEIIFDFKYHPRNTERLPLEGCTNYREIQKFTASDSVNYEVIISAYSNLAVTLRCVHQKILIFDLGWYADSIMTYLSPEYFGMPKSAEELVDQLLTLKSQITPDTTSNDYVDNFFLISPDFINIIQKYFSHSPTRRIV